MKNHFIKLTDEFWPLPSLLKDLSESAMEAMIAIDCEGRDDLTSYCSGLMPRREAEMVMTYVFGKHYDEIQGFYDGIDLFNFLNKTVHEQ